MRVGRPRFLSPQERVRSPQQQQQFYPSRQSTQQRVGKYVYDVNQVLGRGQYSIVYRGFELQNPANLVAVKIITLSAQNNLQQYMIDNEIKILESVQSKYILNLYYHTQVQNKIYLITQYCHRGDLFQRIQRGIIPEDEAIQITLQIAYGLRDLHSQNIIHGDVKSANIFLGDNCVIGDFGFATYTTDSQKSFTVGTPLYMAPELYLFNQNSCSADVWSLGCILYEMVYGLVPFYSFNEQYLQQELEKMKLRGTLQFPQTGVSKKVQALISYLMQYDPSRRLQIQQVIGLLQPSKRQTKGNTSKPQSPPSGRMSRQKQETIQDTNQIQKTQVTNQTRATISLLDLVKYFYNGYKQIHTFEQWKLSYVYLKMANIYYQAYLIEKTDRKDRKREFFNCQNDFFDLEKLIKQDHSEILDDDDFKKYFNGNFILTLDFMQYVISYYTKQMIDQHQEEVKNKVIATLTIIRQLFIGEDTAEDENTKFDKQVLRMHRLN